MISKKEMEAVKNKIERYYYNEKVIVWNQKELERLTKRLQDIESDRNISLCTDLKGIRYDNVGGREKGIPQSPMDRNIEAIYNKLDRSYEETQQNILKLKINIQMLEDEKKQTEFYIHLLNEENKKLLEYKCKYKKSVTQIAFLMHLSKSTVCRSIYEIYQWLYKMMKYDGIFENVKQNETILQRFETK